MKIAVCSQNRKEVTGHAGKCRKFWIYEIENNRVGKKELLELPREQSLHELANSPVNDPTFVHPAYAADVLISGGMGFGLVNRLQMTNTRGIITSEKDPDKAVELFLNDQLPTEAPHRHGHGHGHHH
jgi:predicted Fe-Mo cluster-binding NifX family protein